MIERSNYLLILRNWFGKKVFTTTVVAVVLFLLLIAGSRPVLSQCLEVYGMRSGLPGLNVQAIAFDAQGNAWAGTENGLAEYQGKKGWVAHKDSLLRNNQIFSLAIDNMGQKWIGTEKTGLLMYDGRQWTKYDKDNSPIPDNTVYRVVIDSRGTKWVGTYKGLAEFDGKNWTIYLKDTTITAIFIDRSDNMWIGTYREGLRRLAKGARTSEPQSSKLKGENIWAVAAAGNTGFTWAGSSSPGDLSNFDGVNWTNVPAYSATLASFTTGLDNVTSIAVDTFGNLWVGTYGRGLVEYDGSNWWTYTRDTPIIRLPNNTIQTIAVDKDGNKWVGTHGGVVFIPKCMK
ncbi:MAG TPA: two-component regulator propeller domain-containing protein [Candidatus Kryptonia bacterium]